MLSFYFPSLYVHVCCNILFYYKPQFTIISIQDTDVAYFSEK